MIYNTVWVCVLSERTIMKNKAEQTLHFSVHFFLLSFNFNKLVDFYVIYVPNESYWAHVRMSRPCLYVSSPKNRWRLRSGLMRTRRRRHSLSKQNIRLYELVWTCGDAYDESWIITRNAIAPSAVMIQKTPPTSKTKKIAFAGKKQINYMRRACCVHFIAFDIVRRITHRFGVHLQSIPLNQSFL